MEQEKAEMELLEKHNINFIVLARYMQVISEQMIEAYPNRIINIHHSSSLRSLVQNLIMQRLNEE